MKATRRRGLWRWFAVGFTAIFVGLLVLYTVIVLHPSGQNAVRQRLWEYCENALPRYFGLHTLGYESSISDMLPGMAFEHLALSAVGGCVTAGIAFWFRRKV